MQACTESLEYLLAGNHRSLATCQAIHSFYEFSMNSIRFSNVLWISNGSAMVDLPGRQFRCANLKRHIPFYKTHRSVPSSPDEDGGELYVQQRGAIPSNE
jgi:hypothetical protein